jgi:hypothetical protein
MSNKNDIYLVAFYALKPRPGVNTSKKGWMDNFDNITYDESIEITRGIKKNSSMAKVILNLSQQRVDRNTWGTDRSFREYFKHYFTQYHDYLTTVMVRLDPHFMNEILDEMQAEIDANKEEPAEVPAE